MYVESDVRILLPQPHSLTRLCPFPAFGLFYRLSVPLLVVPFRFYQSSGCVLRTGGEALVPTFCLALVPVLHTSKGSPLLQPGMCSKRMLFLPLLSAHVLSGSPSSVPCEKQPYLRCWPSVSTSLS